MMSTSDHIEARYGEWPITFVSEDDRKRSEIRERAIWRTLLKITGCLISPPWVEVVHSPRALPAFIGLSSDAPQLVWDSGLGTLFNILSFTIPHAQPPTVNEALLRRIVAVRSAISGEDAQSAAQLEESDRLLKDTPIDRSYQLNIDEEGQFAVFLITEMQERFALAHEFCHYIFAVDPSARVAFRELLVERLKRWSTLNKPGVLRACVESMPDADRTDWYEAGLDPYDWFLYDRTAGPSEMGQLPLLADDISGAIKAFNSSDDREQEEILCDLLGSLAVAVDAHLRQKGWTAIRGAASSRLALSNLQTLLEVNDWVLESGRRDLKNTAATRRQRCLNAFLPVMLCWELEGTDGNGLPSVDDIHVVMHLVDKRFHREWSPILARLDWHDRAPHSELGTDEVLAHAGFVPFRASTSARQTRSAAGGWRFEVGNVSLSSELRSRYWSEPVNFREFIDSALARHRRGDWGEVPAGDWEENDEGLFEEDRPGTAERIRRRSKLWSVYSMEGEKVLITTNSARTETEIIFFREYV